MKVNIGMLKCLRQVCFVCSRCYHEGTNNIHKEKQRLQWAGTGDGLPSSHQRFMLLNRKICSKAMSVLVGFSHQTWTKTVKQKSQEIHRDRVHGNTVSTLKPLVNSVDSLSTQPSFAAFCRVNAETRLMGKSFSSPTWSSYSLMKQSPGQKARIGS